MDNFDRIDEILQCVGRIWSECPVENEHVRDDLHTIVDNIKMIRAELIDLLHQMNILRDIDLIDRNVLLQDMTHRGGLGIGNWHVFDIINEQPAINVDGGADNG